MNKIKEEFSNLGFEINDDEVSDILEILANTYKVDAGDLAAEWTAYSFNQKFTSISKENVELFQRDRYESKKKKSHSKRVTPNRKKSTFTKATMETDNQLMDMYSSDSYSTPKNNRVQSRISDSPNRLENSPRDDFEKRSNMNQVVTCYGDGEVKWSSGVDDSSLELVVLQSMSSDTKHIYMYQQYGDQSLAQNERLMRMEAACKLKYLELYDDLMDSTQCEVNLVAKICCDGDVRLTEDNISLRTYDNMVLPLDVSFLNEYSFFPGQIVVLQGKNPTGRSFVTQKVLDQKVLPISRTMLDGELSLMVSSGPYTTTDNFTYDPLDEFLEEVKENSPDAVIMIGPFVDRKHSQIEDLPLTYIELYAQILDKIASALKNVKIEVIIIPSLRDIQHIPIFPQCPLPSNEESQKICKMTFLSNPTTFSLNGVKISVTSTDVVKHLGKHEVSIKTKASPNRMENLILQMLYQQCLYPLYPSDPDILMDYNLAKDLIMFKDTTPNILILPSALSCYVKNVKGCLVLNPGYLTRGKSAGMYARMKLTCGKGSVEKQNVEILRI